MLCLSKNRHDRETASFSRQSYKSVCALVGLKMPPASCSRDRGGGDGEGRSAEYGLCSRSLTRDKEMFAKDKEQGDV